MSKGIMKMTKRALKPFLIIGLVIVFGILIIGITWRRGKETFTYSNLVDAESKLMLQSLLNGSDIPQKNIDAFIKLANEFNSVLYNNIVENGWRESEIQFFSYDANDGFAHLEEQPNNLINCRTAAFVILKDNIVFGETEITPTEKKDPLSIIHFGDKEDSQHYNLLFSNIEGVDTDSSKALTEKVTAYWEMAGIHFPESSTKLVMAYGESEAEIQNFHTAVAIYAEDYVWLLEKVDPIQPYQFSRFSNQKQMIEYMKNRVTETQYAVIFVNDDCVWEK